MARKKRNKNRASVQQTACLNGNTAGFLKGASKFVLGQLLRQLFSEVFHSNEVTAILKFFKDLL